LSSSAVSKDSFRENPAARLEHSCDRPFATSGRVG
jgi:hypothetical protein